MDEPPPIEPSGAESGRTQPQHTRGIETLIPPDWFKNPEQSSIWVRIYTCLFASIDRLAEAIRAWPGVEEPGQPSMEPPTMFGLGTMTGFKLPAQTVDLYARPDGQVVFAIHIAEKELPEAVYAYLATPYRVNGSHGDEGAAKSRLDRLSGLVCLHTGRNLLRDCVFEGEMAAQGGRLHVPGGPKKTPHPMEGPYVGLQNGADIFEMSQALAATAEPKKGRLRLALRLVNTAIRKDEGLLDYWVALEVLCNGKSGRVVDRFCKIYGVRDHKEAARHFGLGVLAQWRGELVHQGRAPRLTLDIERYLQLVFLDLLRFELGLPPRHHAAAMREAAGFDLSPLGLPDNRTAKQKGVQSRPPMTVIPGVSGSDGDQVQSGSDCNDGLQGECPEL